MRSVYIISYTMSLFIAVCVSYAFMTNQHIVEMTTTGKTILILLSAYCFLAFLFLPQLYKKGLMPLNYHDLDKTEKAKVQFLANSIFLPFWGTLIVGVLVNFGINWKTLILTVPFIYSYTKSAVITLNSKRNNT